MLRGKNKPGRVRPIHSWSSEAEGQRGSTRPLIHRARTVAWAHEARIARPGHEGGTDDARIGLCRD